MTVEGLDATPLSGRVAVDALVGEIGRWPGVEVGEHRFGGVAFHLGRRELGHLHEGGRGGGFADVPFPRSVRDELIAAGRARPHHAVPDSGWLTVPIRTVSDLHGALEIFRMSYERASKSRERRAGAPATTQGGQDR
jgi:hypothetical protein